MSVVSAPTGLPPIDDRTAQLLQQTQDSGAHRLLEVDEAGLVAAVGVPPPSGRGPASISPDALDAAGRRLVDAGLAESAPWALARFRPAAALLTYAQLVTHAKAHLGMASSWDVPERPDSVRVIRRVTVLTDVARGGLAVVEQVLLPVEAAPVSLPVDVWLLRLDVVVDAVLADAAATRGGSGRETLVLFGEGRGRQDPSRYRVDADGRGELEVSRHGVLGARTRRAPADAAAFADHLRLRLLAAG
jgi:hypothetical protein